MRVLGYVNADSETMITSVIMQSLELATVDNDEHMQVCALVPVADLDVEAAVERAARARYEQWWEGPAPMTSWPALSETKRTDWRDAVRPIVLAALGIEGQP